MKAVWESFDFSKKSLEKVDGIGYAITNISSYHLQNKDNARYRPCSQ